MCFAKTLMNFQSVGPVHLYWRDTIPRLHKKSFLVIGDYKNKWNRAKIFFLLRPKYCSPPIFPNQVSSWCHLQFHGYCPLGVGARQAIKVRYYYDGATHITISWYSCPRYPPPNATPPLKTSRASRIMLSRAPGLSINWSNSILSILYRNMPVILPANTGWVAFTRGYSLSPNASSPRDTSTALGGVVAVVVVVVVVVVCHCHCPCCCPKILQPRHRRQKPSAWWWSLLHHLSKEHRLPARDEQLMRSRADVPSYDWNNWTLEDVGSEKRGSSATLFVWPGLFLIYLCWGIKVLGEQDRHRMIQD